MVKTRDGQQYDDRAPFIQKFCKHVGGDDELRRTPRGARPSGLIRVWPCRKRARGDGIAWTIPLESLETDMGLRQRGVVLRQHDGMVVEEMVAAMARTQTAEEAAQLEETWRPHLLSQLTQGSSTGHLHLPLPIQRLFQELNTGSPHLLSDFQRLLQ